MLSVLIQALGVLNLIATPIGVLIVLSLRVNENAPLTAATVAWLFAGFIGGMSLGGMLLAAGALLRKGAPAASAFANDFTEREAAPYPAEITGTIDSNSPGPSGVARPDQVMALLRDPGDLTLLPEEEREAARARINAYLQRQAAEAVVNAINLRQLGRARSLHREAEARFGKTATIEKLLAKIDEAAVRHEPLDYASTRRLAERASAAGQWARAEDLVRTLCFNHPESTRCRQLWDDTRRSRLHAHIQSCVDEHQWQEGAAAAAEFLERFPESQEAEALRSQMKTLQTNADIQQRKQFEARFKDLVQSSHYAEALKLARYVIRKFPASPQADAFRAQVPLLEKRLAG